MKIRPWNAQGNMMQPRRLARFAVLSSSSSEVNIVQSSKRSYTVLSTEYQDYINNHPTNPALKIIFSSFLRRNASLLPELLPQTKHHYQAKQKPRERPENAQNLSIPLLLMPRSWWWRQTVAVQAKKCPRSSRSCHVNISLLKLCSQDQKCFGNHPIACQSQDASDGIE